MWQRINLNWFYKKNIFFRISIATALVFFILTSILIYLYNDYTSEITIRTKTETQRKAEITANVLEGHFSRIISIADSIAKELSDGTLKNENIKSRLEQHMNYKNKLCGMGVAFIPNTNNKDLRLKSPYYASRIDIADIDKTELIKVYSAPIYRTDSTSSVKIVTGNVYVDFLASDIKDMMSDLKTKGEEDEAKSGYGFLLSPNGTYIVHPTSEYNMNEENKNAKTIFEVATELDDNKLKELGELAVINSESGIFEHPNEQTGQNSWMFYQPINSINWSLVSVYIIDDMPIERNTLRNYLIGISLCLVVLLIATYTIVTKAYTGKVPRMVLLSVFSSILLFSEIAFVWYLTLEYDILEDKNAIKIVDKTGLDKQKNLYNRKVKSTCSKPVYLPTGIFIEAMEFPSSSNVFLSGILWQKYDHAAQAYLEEDDRGVLFPEATKDELTLTSKRNEGDQLIYQWFFQITLKKSFDFSKYPLDKKDLLIRILPKNFEKNIVLTPALNDYRNINPIKLPGIQKGLVIENWNLMASNFVYKFNDYNTNFGIKNFEECKKDAPELFFDVNLTRNFVGAIISSLLPMLVMLSVLYILITIATRNIDMVARVLGPMGSFFFAILLAHVSLRRDLVVENMVYFEYVYIVMYFMILLIFINTVMYSRETDRFYFHYKKNLITKLLFWPIFNILLLILTLYLLVVK